MRKFILYILFFYITIPCVSQNYSWFYLRAKNPNITFSFQENNNILTYTGNDQKLKNVLSKYTIYEFKKTFKNAKKLNLQKTYFVVTNSRTFLTDILKNANHIFEFGEIISESDKRIFEPNDYGLSSTIGDNLGLPVDLSYLDFLEVPKAWYYTTGSKSTLVGISDAIIDTTNLDFKDKTKVLSEKFLSKGHGSGVASIAASRGDNAYGVPGICYNCNILASSYGDSRNLSYLIDLADHGARVINCSWSSSSFYQTAQDVIDELYERGVIVVASAGNLNWEKGKKGKKLMYPASYNHVISVSAGMYKHDKIEDNLLTESNGNPYAENIKGYVGRTIGFKDHKIGNYPRIYPVSVTSLNKEVDLLAPSTGVLRYGKFIYKDTISYDINEHTSNASPLVSGTIGLMISLYPCLPINEIETILKLTSLNIDHIKANKPYEGNYGAGILSTGKAVEMVYKLYTESEIAVLENQSFNRWNFNIRAISKRVIVKNISFKESSIIDITAKNSIVIQNNTVLKPNIDGELVLKIDPALVKECDLQLREGYPNNKYYKPVYNSNTTLSPN